MNGKIEIVKTWIEKGDHDFGTARITYLILSDQDVQKALSI
jgi:hypothetical protein